MIDEAVLGGVVLSFESLEKGFLGSEDLDRAGGMLGLKLNEKTSLTKSKRHLEALLR